MFHQYWVPMMSTILDINKCTANHSHLTRFKQVLPVSVTRHAAGIRMWSRQVPTNRIHLHLCLEGEGVKYLQFLILVMGEVMRLTQPAFRDIVDWEFTVRQGKNVVKQQRNEHSISHCGHVLGMSCRKRTKTHLWACHHVQSWQSQRMRPWQHFSSGNASSDLL